MEYNNDEEVILNTQEENVDLDTTQSDESSETSEAIDWKAEALKYKEIADNQKIRAEKIEKKFKETKDSPKETQTSNSNLSSMDIIALTKANIETEDIEEVIDYAKFKGISISEALKSSVVKATLQERAEQRNVALATNTGGAKRGSAKISDETLLANARKGILPESDADIDRLMKAQMARK